jgi:hypothetical protein
MTRQQNLRDTITLDGNFQTACQRYAHQGGSSAAIAAAAMRVIGDDFADAISIDPEGLIAVLDLARQIWEGEELANWMHTPQPRWEDRSPIQMCAQMLADDVLEVLEGIEVR